MKRDFLESLLADLNAPSQIIDKIMKENGKDIEGAKAKYADYDDIKAQLEAANAAMEKFTDYDATKAEVEKYKAELKKSQEESAAKIAAMERSAKVSEYLSAKKFVNDITRDAIAARMGEMLGADESKGKSLEDIFGEITKDKKNILEENDKPSPPKVGQMGGMAHGTTLDETNAARAVMGLAAKKE